MIRRGLKTSELWLAIGTLALAWWMIRRGHSGAQVAAATAPGAAYALGRSFVKAAAIRVTETLTGVCMSTIQSSLATMGDGVLDKNATLAKLEPELGQLVYAIINLSAKALSVFVFSKVQAQATTPATPPTTPAA